MHDISRLSILREPPFREGDWWVDDLGRFHAVEPLKPDTETYLYHHLGLMRVTATPCGIVVQWSVRTVEREILDRVCDRLSRCPIDTTVRLKFYFSGWVDESYPETAAAIARIQGLHPYRDVQPLETTFLRKRDIAEIDQAKPLISRGFEMWERAGGEFSHAPNEELVGLLPYALMFRPNARDHLVFSFIGNMSPAKRIYGDDWAASAVDQPYARSLSPANHPYDERVCSVYDGIFETGEPRYDHIRALIHPDGKEAMWVAYERLLTRCRLHNGRSAVVCLVKSRQDICIPLAAAA